MDFELDKLLPEEVRDKLIEALKNDKYFITVSYLDDSANVQHYYKINKFFNNDVEKTLKKINKMFKSGNKQDSKW